MVRELLEVFSIDLPSVQSDYDIDFGIDFELGTHPIFYFTVSDGFDRVEGMGRVSSKFLNKSVFRLCFLLWL